MAKQALGVDAIRVKGWLVAHRFLLLRRFSQLMILGLFLLGPWFGMWLVKGNLSASLTLGVLPLTDPYVLLQSMLAGNWPTITALVGAVIVLLFYVLVGGKAYCAWVCPLNMVTDTASWLRTKLGIKSSGKGLPKQTRFWLLGISLLLPVIMGTMVWELINPVSLLHRGILFGMGVGWLVIALIFLFDLLVSKNGWCGRLCPVGAFYSLLGRKSLLRVNVVKQDACNDCLECFVVCPEPQVIGPALRGNRNTVILAEQCSNCGRCIDICAPKVFEYSSRFNNQTKIIENKSKLTHVNDVTSKLG